MQTSQFIQALNDQKIAQAIAEAELRTSGEIRVFVSEVSEKDPVLSAERQFLRLGMQQTDQRNAVLIFFAPKSQNFAVIGDKGVHDKCGQEFWQHIIEEMCPLLKSGKYTEAIILAVHELGAVLARHFPFQQGDRNELPNRVERGGADHP